MALNSAGTSSASATLSVTIGLYPAPPPVAPQLSSCSSSSIVFIWNASSNSNGASLTNYYIYVNDVYTASVASTVLTYTLSALTTGSSYKVQVSAINSIGEGDKSQSAVFYAVDVPSAPTLTLTNVQADSCMVNWTAVTAPTSTLITGYVVKYDNYGGSGYVTGCDYSTNPSQLSCTLSSLQTGSKIAIKANTLNKGGKSADSTVVYCTPVGKPGQPGSPQLVTSSAASIQVKWAGASSAGGVPITGYMLYADEEESTGTASVENWIQVYQGTALTATMTTGITAGKSYRFKVQAMNSVNSGLFSNIVSFVAGSVPPAPTSFAVASTSRTWLSLSWTKPTLTATTDPAIAGYLLSTDYGSMPSYSAAANITNGDQLAYNLTGQPTGSTYNFKIVAYNRVGSSADSSVVSGTFADVPAKMSAPYYVASSKVSTTVGSLTVGWNTVSDSGGVPVTGYKLYLIDTVTSAGGLAYDGTGIPAVLQYTSATLTLGRKYQAYVTALNPKEGTASDVKEFYAAALPGTVSAITAVSGSQTETCIGIQWTAPDNGGTSIVLYEVYTQDGTLRYAGTSTQAYVCGLTTGAQYGFSVQTTNLAGKGSLSSAFNFIIAGVPSVPRYVRSTSATSSSQAVLLWEVPSSLGGAALTGYKVYRKLSTATVLTVLATVDPSIVTYTDSTVAAGTSYTYAVTAVNSVGESDSTATINVVPMSVPSAPAAPTLLSQDRYSIRVGWTAPSATNGGSVQSYWLFMKKVTDTDYSVVYTGSGTDYLAAGLTPGEQYVFKVTATNAAGESSSSSASSAILAAEIPTAPTNLRVTSRGSGAITLMWDIPSDTGGAPLTGYVVESAAGSGSYAAVTFSGNSNPGINYVALTGLTVCTMYSFRVYSVSAQGQSLPSTVMSAYASGLPVAPTSAPTISALTKYSLTVTMTALTGTDTGGCAITYYKVYASVNGNSYVEVGSTASTSYVLTGIQLSSVYQIKYAASNKVYDEGNSFGASLLSSPIVTVTVAVQPQPPDNFGQGAVLYRDSVLLEWDVPSDTGGAAISSYSLVITDVAATTSTTVSIAAGSTSYTATGLTPGKSYTFAMATVTSAGTSSYTSALTTMPGLYPISPSGLAIGSKTRSAFTASWTTVTAEDTGGTSSNPITISMYQIVLRDMSTGVQNTYSTAAVSYVFSYLTPGTLYSVKLQTCTAVGCSDFSAQVTATVGLSPGIPSSLTVTTQSHTSISIAWQEPSDDGGSLVSGYQVGITVSGTETVKSGIYSTTYTFATADGLVAGTTYLFRVSAVNSVGAGSWTGQTTGYSSDLPATVSGLTSSAVTQTSATVSWALLTTSDAKGYPVTNPSYVLESALCLDARFSILLSSTTATSYAVTGATPGTCIRYRMKVSNTVGDSAYCSSIDVLYASVPGTPSAPTLVLRNSTTADGTYIKVAWAAPVSNGGSPILGYILEQVAGASATTWATVYDGSTNPSTLTYVSQGLVAGTIYRFRISARNLAGVSTASAELSVLAGTVPGKVSALAVSSRTVSGSSSQLVMTWTLGATGGSAITIHYVTYNVMGSTATTVSTGSATATYTITGLTAGVSYVISVAASNAIYDSNNLEGLSLVYSDPLTTVMANVPSQITAISQTSSTVANQVILTWTAPSNGGSAITNYTLNKDNGAGVYYVLYTGAAANYTDTSAVGGNTYTYTVLATNAAGSGVVSSSFTATAGTVPGVVTSLKIASQSSTAVTISWTAPSSTGGFAISKYWVMHDTGDMTYLAAVDNALAVTYSLTIASSYIGLRFRFKVAAATTVGVGSYSSEISAVAANAPNAPAITVSATARTLNTAQVTWTQPSVTGGSPIIGYIVRRDSGVLGSTLNVVYNGTGSPQVLSYTLTSLTAGASYTLSITAVNTVGESATPATAILVAGTRPSKIASVSLVSSASTGTIEIAWTVPADLGGNALTKYRLYIVAVGSSFGTPTDYTTLTTLDYIFSGITSPLLIPVGLTSGTTYQIAVSAVNAVGESDLSTTVLYPAADKPCTITSAPTVAYTTRY